MAQGVGLTSKQLRDPSLLDWLSGQIAEQAARLKAAARTRPPEWICQDFILANRRIRKYLHQVDLDDPNPFQDLDAWHTAWARGDLGSSANVDAYVEMIYSRLLRVLHGAEPAPSDPMLLLDGWPRVDRAVRKAYDALELAQHEEEFQAVGLFCREAVITLAQTVFDASRHPTADGIDPSATDAKRMLDAYIAVQLAGSSHEAYRRHARACMDLANDVQHRRTGTFRAAALCAEATRSLVTMIAVLEGRRDPLPLSERAT